MYQIRVYDGAMTRIFHRASTIHASNLYDKLKRYGVNVQLFRGIPSEHHKGLEYVPVFPTRSEP